MGKPIFTDANSKMHLLLLRMKQVTELCSSKAAKISAIKIELNALRLEGSIVLSASIDETAQDIYQTIIK